MAEQVITAVVGQNSARKKTVGDPIPEYESLVTTWARARAIMGGQAEAKAFDKNLDTVNYKNLLIPFSPKMEQDQYNFYRSEAELPGLVSQYAKVLVGGLLRKQPTLRLPKSVDPNAMEWLTNSFGADGNSLLAVMDEALWEELQTSRAWLLVDYPEVTDDPDDASEQYPYCIVIKAENVINWRRAKNNELVKFTMRYFEEEYLPGEHHPTLIDTVKDYYMDDMDRLAVQKYQLKNKSDVAEVVGGEIKTDFKANSDQWEKIGEPIYPMMHGNFFDYIPAMPLNGSITPVNPLLQTLIDREIALYNKISRRNHLLYGAATYTPVISADLSQDQVDEIINSGLGTWIVLPATGKADVLHTPTEALADMEKSIEATISEMARMGIRMLTPDGTPQESGVALEVKNAGQTAQLGLLNNKISRVMEILIKIMLQWKYDIAIEDMDDLEFNLSEDFNPTPIGADWMRLVTEWYESGKIPRSLFLSIAKQNDIVPSDYDDKAGKQEIQSDDLLNLAPTKIDSSMLADVHSAVVPPTNTSNPNAKPKA